MNLPTVVPNRGLPKHHRQNRRNKCHRFTALSSCLPAVGPVARRDGGGGDRARELHASNFSKDRTCLKRPARSRTTSVSFNVRVFAPSRARRRHEQGANQEHSPTETHRTKNCVRSRKPNGHFIMLDHADFDRRPLSCTAPAPLFGTGAAKRSFKFDRLVFSSFV